MTEEHERPQDGVDAGATAADEVYERLSEHLNPGDDPALWSLAVAEYVAAVTGADTGRHLILTFARVPERFRGGHADDHATLRLSWERDRGDPALRFVGEHPRVRRRRGHYTASVCIPKGTRRLAFVAVPILWRPRLPWAPPEDTSMGRQEMTFSRGADSRWHFRGMREVH